MKTLLVLAPHPELPEAIRAAVNREQYRIIHRATVDEAEPLLVHRLVSACIVDVELSGVQEVWILEKLRRQSTKCPIIIYTGARQWEWEEEAYLHGATYVLAKPVRPRMFRALLDRLWAKPEVIEAPSPAPAPSQQASPAAPAIAGSPPSLATNYQGLGAVRAFSAILTHSLDADAMLKQFLLLLHDLIGINRAAVFLRHPGTWLGEKASEESRRMQVACSIGINPGLFEYFQLASDSGIGGQVGRLGRILRRQEEDARRDSDTQREFELLGAQTAVPILDRETVIGVAVFDTHITGEPLANGELELIFHLLEQLGLAIKNIWLHDQLAVNNTMMAEILREVTSACVVVSRDLAVLHANKAARRFFPTSNKRTGELEFSDLPQLVGSKVYQVLKTGTALPTFRFEPEDSPGTVYSITIVPFQRGNSAQPASALLMMEDLTNSEQLRRLEIEAANLRLVRTMADRLAHEVGNAMVPLSTHQQLLADKYKDPEFRASLDAALADGVKRVTRLINQMRFLARDTLASAEAFPLSPLVEEAYQEARKHQPAKASQLKCEDEEKPIIIKGDRAALKHALTEVILNALQANPKDPKIGVRMHTGANGKSGAALEIEVQDNGTGFTAETAQKAPSPFYTTRNVGLGLGLTVSRKIIETHHGKLEIVPPKSGQSGIVRISLPMEFEAGAASR
ncbi:MAG TPA: ATP-binding protein [Verrucomicrobiae bacterium]|nr:ATP-binding protein [Verrucomicrobiae bacterium]